ncbi:MAG: hypothetical protein M1828_001265 [Chrysothrix sp. TS-e1954]|nr:MAG: hypothetical protein M1828_001265 [Chrysothrix sp. TS-e1954]
MPHSTEHESLFPRADASEVIKATHYSALSPDGLHIASLSTPTTLTIHTTSSLSDPVLTINIPSTSSSSRSSTLHWSPATSSSRSTRILLSSEDTVRIYDITDPGWSAVISNGSGSAGSHSHVDFGCDDAQILAFSEFSASLTVWCLHTGQSVSIRDPKFPSPRSYSRSKPGRKGVLALLSRPGSQDVLSLHAASNSQLIKSITLPTIDAQGLRYSPEGKWLAVWDTPSMGYKVMIFTADGNLYRINSGDYFDDSLAGLGVRTIEWSPDGSCLAIGGYEKRITLLSTQTFSPAIHLSHPVSANPARCPVHQETNAAYTTATSTINPPTSSSSPSSSTSSSSSTSPSPPPSTTHLTFSPNSTLLASVSSQTPTTVWLWDLTALRLRAVLVQHADVRRLSWHPTRRGLLLIRTAGPPASDGASSSGLYLWDVEDEGALPRVLTLPSPAAREGRSSLNGVSTAKLDAAWVSAMHPSYSSSSSCSADPSSDSDLKSPSVFLNSTSHFALLHPYGRPSPASSAQTHTHTQPLSTSPVPTTHKVNKDPQSHQTESYPHPEGSTLASDPEPEPQAEEGEEGDDSLFEILTGKSSNGPPQQEETIQPSPSKEQGEEQAEAGVGEEVTRGEEGDSPLALDDDDDRDGDAQGEDEDTFQHLRHLRRGTAVRAA